MSEIKMGLEVIEQAVYEILGLALPGAAAVGGLTCVIVPEAAPHIFAWAGRHELATLAVAYVAGYVVQGVSRPVTNLTRTILGAPLSIARNVKSVHRAAGALGRAWSRITSGHRPYRAAHDASTVNLTDLVRERWEHRLGLAPGVQLRDCDAFDLAYSRLGAEQRRLSRFRASVSLCRAMATACAAAFWGLVVLLVVSREFTWAGAVGATALWVAFAAFIERADMYDALWRSIVPAQFLADDAAAAPTSTAPTTNGTRNPVTPLSGVSVPVAATVQSLSQLAPALPELPRDEAPSPMTISGAQGTAPKTGNGGPLA